MEPLEPPDLHFLRAAWGWIELGDWREANAELERIAPALRAHPYVLTARYEICAKAEQWDAAAETASALVAKQPEEPQFWIFHAYATRRGARGGITKAKRILALARGLFPKEPLICYNLACYECQLGHLKKAMHWLSSAFDLGNPKHYKSMAREDPDLEPLRAYLERK